MGSVFGSFSTLEKHLTSFMYPESPVGAQLKHHCLVKLQYRRSYLLRPAHVLAYLLDPRYLGAPNQPTQDEIESAMVLMQARVFRGQMQGLGSRRARVYGSSPAYV